MKNKLSLLAFIGILLFSISSVAQPYCSSSYPNYFTDYISNVSFNSISNPSGPTGYSDFTLTDITEVGLGVQYTLTASVVNFNPTTIYVMAWIDWNHDYDFFDAGEAYTLGPVVGPTFGTNVSINILVPAGAVLDTTRLRISASRGFVPDPCNSGGYLFGETEDYSVSIVSSPILWDGEVDTDWNNPLNWSGDVVPNVTDDVIIPTGVGQYPIIPGVLSVGANFAASTCKSLIINSGASSTITVWGQIMVFNSSVSINTGGSLIASKLLLGNGGALYINGGSVTIDEESTFSFNSLGNMNGGDFFLGGDVYFESTCSWAATGGTIYAMSTLNTIITKNSPTVRFNNFTIQSGATASISGNSSMPLFLYGSFTQEPNSEFTMEAPVGGGNVSQIIVSQDLTVEGTLAGNASFIDENGSTVITYGVNAVENFYAGSRWHYISAPVSSAVSGVFTGLYLKAFIEPIDDFTPEPGITSTTHPLNAGQGFEVWSGLGDQTISYVGGTLNTGNIAASVTATDINTDLSIGDGEGWNLIGNPFPSAVDVGTENDPVTGYSWTNIDSTIYAWNGTSYSTFNLAGDGLGTNGGTRYLPSMQGFFVKANDFNPTFSFANNARLHNAQANYKSSVDHNLQIRMVITGNGYSDEMIIRAINSATELFDSKYDAYKLPGLYEVPSLFTKAGSSELSINTFSEFNEEMIVPVFVKVGKSGIYKIESKDFDLSELGLNVYLEDLKEEYNIMLDETSIYEFSSELNDNEHRFNLKFKKAVADEEISFSSIHIYSADDIIYINKKMDVKADIFVYDLMGREVMNNINNTDAKAELQMLNGTGYYIVKVISENEIVSEKIVIR